MLKIFQKRLQQYMNQELPGVQAGYRQGRGTREQIANICWIMEKARVPEIHLSSIQLLIMSDSLWPRGLSMPGFPVHQQLPELIQTQVLWVGDAIQASHLLSFPSPPTFNLSQHQGLVQWIPSSHKVTKVLEVQLQHESFQWIFRTDFL